MSNENAAAELLQLKKRMTRLRSKIDQAQGALDGEMVRLKGKWECDSLDDARTLLQDKRQELESVQTKFDSAYEEFQREWGPRLEELEKV